MSLRCIVMCSHSPYTIYTKKNNKYLFLSGFDCSVRYKPNNLDGKFEGRWVFDTRKIFFLNIQWWILILFIITNVRLLSQNRNCEFYIYGIVGILKTILNGTNSLNDVLYIYNFAALCLKMNWIELSTHKIINAAAVTPSIFITMVAPTLNFEIKFSITIGNIQLCFK